MSSTAREYNHLLKLVLIGDTGAGKSCLLLRFADDTFTDSYISTIGVDFRFRTIEVDQEIVKLQIWDTAGQERFRTITSAYYRGADAILLVYDCTNEQSLNNISEWLTEVNKYASESVPKILVGCKADLDSKRQVTAEQGQKKAAELGLEWIETSAKEATNVEEPFLVISRTVLKQIDEQQGQETNQSRTMRLESTNPTQWMSQLFGDCCPTD